MSEASLSSWGRRFCRVPNLRAPRASGEEDGDVLDAELAKGAPDLGRVVLVDLAAGLRRVEVVVPV